MTVARGLLGPMTSMAGRYPGTVVQFAGWFPDDAACLDYLAWLRWGDAGFGCYLCGVVGRGWPRADGASWDCGACGSRTSATAGTMLHRFRLAMVMPDRAKLSGVVEVDDMFVGGRNKPGMAGRPRRPHKTPVLMMAEVRSRGIGRCRAVVLPRLDGASLRAALNANIEQGSTIRSDGLVVLAQSMDGYVHDRISVQGSGTPAHVLFPVVSRVQSQAKRWLEGTLQGAAEPEHLQAYLNEFEFRFNRRKARTPGLLFYRLLEQAVHTAPATYTDIATGGTRPRKTAPALPPGPRGLPQTLAQPDAGRPWRSTHL